MPWVSLVARICSNAGLQCAVQLTEGNDGGVCAQALDHAVHDGVVGHAQLQALEISDAGNGLDREEVTEALLAVEDTTNGQAQLLGARSGTQVPARCWRSSRSVRGSRR